MCLLSIKILHKKMEKINKNLFWPHKNMLIFERGDGGVILRSAPVWGKDRETCSLYFYYVVCPLFVPAPRHYFSVFFSRPGPPPRPLQKNPPKPKNPVRFAWECGKIKRNYSAGKAPSPSVPKGVLFRAEICSAPRCGGGRRCRRPAGAAGLSGQRVRGGHRPAHPRRALHVGHAAGGGGHGGGAGPAVPGQAPAV